MPRKALRCSVELQIHAVTCPGVYLPHRDDVYLSIHMFGENRKSQLLSPTFPLLFHERFRINKIFYAAFEPSQVAANLEIEPVTIELIQLSAGFGRILASFTTNARDFLYPYRPVTSYTHRTQDRDVLMDRSSHLPGIAPRLEFATKTSISETDAPSLDIWDDLSLLRALDDEPSYSRIKSARRARSRTRSRSRGRRRRSQRSKSLKAPTRGSERYQRSTFASAVRCRSASPDRLVGRMSAMRFEDDPDYYDDGPKPPFVVRHVDTDKLIGRVPGTLDPLERRRRSRSAGRSRRVYNSGAGYYKSGYSSMDDDYAVRNALTQPRNYSYYSDDDRALDQLLEEYLRRREDSPERHADLIGYDDEYVAGTKYGRRLRRATSPLRRSLTSEPLRRSLATDDYSGYTRRSRYDNPGRLYSSYQQRQMDQELEDLKVDLELARTRRELEDEYERRAVFPGISRSRDQFNSKLYNTYSDMYKHRPFYS